MRDTDWDRGMGELIAQPWPSFGDDTPERKAARGLTYRRELDGLSGELWLASVRMAIQRCRRFPTVAELLQYASEAAEAAPARAALPPGPNCPTCDGTGWERVELDTRSDGQKVRHMAVRRCHCRTGGKAPDPREEKAWTGAL